MKLPSKDIGGGQLYLILPRKFQEKEPSLKKMINIFIIMVAKMHSGNKNTPRAKKILSWNTITNKPPKTKHLIYPH